MRPPHSLSSATLCIHVHAQLRFPRACGCAATALPGCKVDCKECEDDKRTSGIRGASSCGKCTKAIAAEAEQHYEAACSADPAPGQPRAVWMLKQLDAATNPAIRQTGADAKPVTISDRCIKEWAAGNAGKSFIEFPAWVLIDYECAAPCLRHALHANPGLVCALTTHSVLARHRNFVLKPRALLSHVITDTLPPHPTTEGRVAHVKKLLGDYEKKAADHGCAASCGSLQMAVLGFDDGIPLGLRSTEEATQSFASGAGLLRIVGECCRRAPECCTHLNYAYFEMAPSNNGNTRGTHQPPTSTGEVYMDTHNNYLMQDSSSVVRPRCSPAAAPPHCNPCRPRTKPHAGGALELQPHAVLLLCNLLDGGPWGQA